MLLEELQFFFSKFAFRCHGHVMSCEISPVSRFRYPYRCFSYHFCFLIIIDLSVLISDCCYWPLLLVFFSFCIFIMIFESSKWYTHEIFNADASSTSFFSGHIQSMLHIGCMYLPTPPLSQNVTQGQF